MIHFRSRAISLLVAVVMVLSTLITTVPVFAATSRPTTGEDAAAALQEVALLQGDENGDLMLGNDLTREQMMVIMSRLMGVEDEAKNYAVDRMTFTDVPMESEYAPYVAWALDNGITEGYSLTQFGFGDKLTAWQAEAFFVRALGYTDTTDEEISAKAEELGIMANASVSEKKPINRADMALLMYNTLTAKNSDGEVLATALGVELPGMEPPAPAALEMTAKMAADDSMKVTFNRAVADTAAMKFDVTGATSVVPTATWNTEKTEATLKFSQALLEGAYTVKASGDTFAEGKDSVTLMVVKNGIAKIEILGDKAVRTDATHAQFQFRLTDSYGNDVTEKMSYDVAYNTSLGANTASLKDYKTGLVEVTKGTSWTDYPVTPELVTVTLYAKTAVAGAVATASKTLSVTELTRVDKVVLGAIEYPVTSPATTTVKVGKSIAAYIPMTVTDKFGQAVTETTNLNRDDSKDVFYSISDSTIKSNLTVEKYTNAAGKDALRLVVSTQGLTESDANRQVSIQVISKFTGSQSNTVSFTLKKSSAAEKVTLMAPEKLVAAGDTYEEGLVIPMVVVDQDGKQLTPDEIVDNAGNITITAAGAVGEDAAKFDNLKIATQGVNKGKIVGSTKLISKGTKTVMAQVKNSLVGSVSSITFEVKEAAYPREIRLRQTPAQNLLAGATTKYSYKFMDQYGREMKDLMLSNLGNDYKVRFTTSNGTYVTTLGYADGDANEVNASTLTADDKISVTAKMTAGTTRIKAELMDKGSATAVVSSVETSFTVTEGMPSNLTYEIADVPTLYAYPKDAAAAAPSTIDAGDIDTANKIQAIDVSTATNVATLSHIVPISIVGRDSSGTTYAVPMSNILSVSSADPSYVNVLKVGDTYLNTLDNKVVVYGIDSFLTTDASDATKTVAIKVVVSSDNGVKEVTKNITVSNAPIRTASVVFADKPLKTVVSAGPRTELVSVTALDTEAKVLTDLAGSTTEINNQVVYVYEVDEFGVYTDVSSTVDANGGLTIVNKNYYATDAKVDYDASTHKLAVDPAKIVANKQVYLMHTAASSGQYGQISVRANNGTTALDLTAPTVALTYSVNPAKAGAMTITATYSEAVAAGETPAISINQPGTTDITAQNMTVGANRTIWTYAYIVNTATGGTYVDGNATVTLSAVHDAAGNTAEAPTNATFAIDTTAPTAAVTSGNATSLVLTFSEVLYNSGTAVVNGDVKSLFTLGGATAGSTSVTSATYNSSTRTVTFVLAGLDDQDTLTVAGTVTDQAGNAVDAATNVYTYTAGTTSWAAN